MENARVMNESLPTMPGWRSARARYRTAVLLAPATLAQADGIDGALGGFEVRATLLDPGLPVPAETLRAIQAIVVEVRCDQASSMDRLQKLLAEAGEMPVLAAVRDPALADVRKLMQIGVADILPLPLRAAELGPALERIAADLDRRSSQAGGGGRTISIVKSRGGVGATAILTQTAVAAARAGGGEACLVDLDVQCGNAALYLGKLPALNLKDLLAAGGRLDASLLRATLTRHESGLSYLAAPDEIMPLDAVSGEQVDGVLDLACREFETLFVDLPHDWTDWSLSVLARSETVLLVCDLSVASLHQAKRKLELLRQHDIRDNVQVVMNKVAKGLFKTINFEDAARILSRDVGYSVADDAETFRAALDQGEAVAAINARSRAAKDLQLLADALRTARVVAG